MAALNPGGFQTRNRIASRRTGQNFLQAQGLNNSARVIGRRSAGWHPNWDRNHDHFWHGHRCHWRNNSWVIFDLGFFPYGYYGYGDPYSYYGDGYGYGYGDGYGYDSEYSDAAYPAQYSDAAYPANYSDGGADSIVSRVQAALAREGYYRGAIDGSFGAGTRKALRRYQANHDMDVTGQIDQGIIGALGLRS
jgi:hypothetical protein